MKPIISELQAIVGHAQVLITEIDKAPYTKGFRVGKGDALAIVIPETLLEIWQVLQCCVQHDVIILMQASNTGVTGGSTPDANDYDREIIIVSTRKVKGVQLLDNAKQVLAFPGSTLTELENALKPHHREAHSVIGSSCIGASVIGGVCNNSGGSLIRRGPAFTEKSLFAQINSEGKLELINHLGIELGKTPEEILANLEQANYQIGDAPDWQGRIWAEGYAEDLRDISSAKPTRFNGNPNYLHDSAGCSGKLAVFAVRLPTFEKSAASTTLYIGTNDEYELVQLRRFLLQQLSILPSQAEYIHRHAFDLTKKYAKHIYKAIDKLGPEKIPDLFAAKTAWDKRVQRIPFLPKNTVDRVIQWVNCITPSGIEPRIMQYHAQFEHHLMIKTDADQAAELQQLLTHFFADGTGQFFQCSEKEEKNAFLIRFGVGGCTVYYCESHGIDTNERLIAFDVALRRNDDEWRLKLPKHLQDQVLFDSCCGHFFCFVNHQDYILKPGVDGHAFKQEVLKYLDERGAKYPAEHNVGHLYRASETYKAHLQQLDPTNSFNPGIGKTSKCKHWN
ncbi:D-lactate dehydrogenase [Acinetobacter sp. MD2(2019)]|nr:D-lactate dehydrogenase [Acinetobacter sp. MD2(2019)]MEB3753350.1 D-lactate dehydrogenase [Acinetobacter sp. MD2(2019)]